MAEFLVLDLPLAFNAITGRPSQVEFNMFCDIRSLTITFKTPRADTFTYALQLSARTNYVAILGTSTNIQHLELANEAMEVANDPRLDDLTNEVEVSGKKIQDWQGLKGPK